jgi:hypothetical protein
MRTMINILPASYRRQQILRSRCVQWTSIIVVALVTGWGWHWLEMHEYRQLSQQLDVLSREHAPTRTMLQHVVDMRKKLKELQVQETVAKELETQRNALKLLGVISKTAAKTEGRLRVTKLELTNFQNAGRIEKPTGAAPVAGGLLLSGVSLDNQSVSDLHAGLQSAGIFSRVELLKLKEREGASLRDYELRCQF